MQMQVNSLVKLQLLYHVQLKFHILMTTIRPAMIQSKDDFDYIS